MNIRGVLITTSLFLGIALVVVSALFFVGYIALSDSSDGSSQQIVPGEINPSSDASSSSVNSVNPLNPLAQPINSTVQSRRSSGGGGGSSGGSGGGSGSPTTPATDTTLPLVTLTSLGPNANTSSAFVFAGMLRGQITDETALSSATLYVWDATTHQITSQQSVSLSGTSANPTFPSLTLPAQGSYRWNIWANDSSGNSAFASANYTLNYIASAPTQCNDGVDNDGDLWVDFPNDADCTSVSDNDESGSPIYVCTPAQLDNIRNNLGANYVQTCDIDLTGLSWTPIGMDENGNSVAFTGSYNGNGHTITHLTVDLAAAGIQPQSTDELGLFARLYGANISYLSLGEIQVHVGPGIGGVVAGSAYESNLQNIAVVDAALDGDVVDQIDMSVLGGVIGIASGSAFDGLFLQNIAVSGGRVGGVVGHALSLPSMNYDPIQLYNLEASAINAEGIYVGGAIGSMDGASGIAPTQQHSFGKINLNSDVICGDASIDLDCVAGGFGGLMEQFMTDNIVVSGSVIDNTKSGIIGGFAGEILGGYTFVKDSHSLSLVEGNAQLGGFAGEINGSASILITQSSAHGNVVWNFDNSASDADKGAGGFVGSVDGKVTISESFSEGRVTGGDYVGGFLGIAHSDNTQLQNVYSTGDVVANDFGAGFVGDPQESSISNAYAVGHIDSANSGGFSALASNGGGSVSSCYWNTETSGLSSSPDCIGLKTSELFKQGTYTGWNFTNIWEVNEGLDYPRLQWERNIAFSPLFGGEGNFVQRNFGIIMIVHIILFVLLLIALVMFYYKSRRESAPLSPAPTMTPTRPMPPSSPAPSLPMQPRPAQTQPQRPMTPPAQNTLNFRSRPVQFGQSQQTDLRNKKL